jgi:Tfp pilus assembly protein PilF
MDRERVDTLEKLMGMDPKDSFAPYALGLEYMATEPERALDYFGEALERDPDFVGAYFQAAKTEVERGEVERAKQRFGEALAAAERTQDWHAHGEIEEALDEIT